jgi:hypothetical protein
VRQPRKIITRVIVFLLLGAIVNVAVAWGCASVDSRFLQDPADTSFVTSNATPRWYGYRLIRFGIARYICARDDVESAIDVPLYQPPYWSAAADQPRGAPGNLERDVIIEEVAGWPWQSLWCTHVAGWTSDAKVVLVSRIDGGYPIDLGLQSSTPAGSIEIHPRIWYSRALPLRPVWPGLAINTVFYAVILWLLFAAPFALGRRRRIKRGLCPACAYPVGDRPVCTECGRPVAKRPIRVAI